MNISQYYVSVRISSKNLIGKEYNGRARAFSSRVIGSPCLIDINDLSSYKTREFADAYRKTHEVFGENMHLMLKNTIQKYDMLSNEKMDSDESSNLLQRDFSIMKESIKDLENLVLDPSFAKKNQKILEIQINSIMQQLESAGKLIKELRLKQNFGEE